MKRHIRQKLNSKSGFTMVEMLCCCLILILLSMVINSELSMVGTLYGNMIAENEAQILLSSASSVLSDELRYAVETNVPDGDTGLTLSKDGGKFEFESDTYWNNGEKTEMYINGDGRLMVKKSGAADGEYPVLPASDYGNSSISGATYKIDSIKITKSNASSGKLFTYTITVQRGTGKYGTAKGEKDEIPPTATCTVRNMPHQN